MPSTVSNRNSQGIMGQRVLLVEDDASLARSIVEGLSDEGFTVAHAADGDAAREALLAGEWDLVILDWWLPGPDGLAVLKGHRRESGTTPVLFLTARDAVSDRVRGLDGGADDYLCKPFGMPELVARVESALRRTASGFRGQNGAIELPGLVIDSELRRVFVDGEDAGLTVLEFRLLHAMASESGRALSRDQLRRRVWGMPHTKRDRSVDVCIRKLRAKLDCRSSGYTYIHTHPGVGYRFAAEPKGSELESQQPQAAG